MEEIDKNELEKVVSEVSARFWPKLQALNLKTEAEPLKTAFLVGFLTGKFEVSESNLSEILTFVRKKGGDRVDLTPPLELTQPLDDLPDSEPEIITSKDIKRSLKAREGASPTLAISEENEKLTKHTSSEENLDLIKRLQEEEERAYREEVERRRKLQEDFEAKNICNICLCELMSEKIFALEDCSHVFHESCLRDCMLSEIKTKKPRILCPGDCKIEINIEDLRSILPKSEIEQFYKNTLENFIDSHADDMSWCPTADCKYAFVKHEEDDDTDFMCPICKKRYCLNCRVEFHNGQSCKEYRISSTQDKFVKGKKFKQCSKCHFWVEKNQGCDHMTCRCGYQFCYKCGGVYLKCECVEKQKLEMERRRNMNMKRKLKRKK